VYKRETFESSNQKGFSASRAKNTRSVSGGEIPKDLRDKSAGVEFPFARSMCAKEKKVSRADERLCFYKVS
jgi:hypothetical protein